MVNTATAFAPATVANVGIGFDILGFAIEGIGDRVTVTRTSSPGVQIEKMDGISDAGSIPLAPEKNTAGMPLLKMLAELNLEFGFSVKIEKNIPLGSGMGGSAASAVGAVVAANALLPKPFSLEKLLNFALEGEAIASGAKHADNVAPCLFGGLTLSSPGENPVVSRLPYPKDMYCVVVHPAMRLDTEVARAALKTDLSLRLHVQQSAKLAAFIAGCCNSDLELIRRGLDDLLIEPQRAPLIPGFAEVKKAALASGALGSSISGAGPSIFALMRDRASAVIARDAMIAAFGTSAGLSAKGWISTISMRGAHLV